MLKEKKCKPRILYPANHMYKLHDTEFCNDFLDMTLKAQVEKVKIGRWDYIKL